MTQSLSAEEQSKDRYFQKLAQVAEEMVGDHGKDFAAGALVLAARWVAENRLGQPKDLKH